MTIVREQKLRHGFGITRDRAAYRDAHVVVFHLPEWKWMRHFRFPKKLPHQLWVAMTMECDENYPYQRDANFMRAFDVRMTYHLDADIPARYFGFYSSWAELSAALKKMPAEKNARAPVASFISSRVNHSGRRAYARELMRNLDIDSYGKFMRNARLARDIGRASKLETLARYKFTLAFENAIGRDYVTEKFYDPLICGSVPIYLGAPNIETFAPGDHCYINVNDFANPRALAEYVRFLAHDENAYNAYFAWKQKPLRAGFVDLAMQMDTSSETRLCEWLENNYQRTIAARA